MNSDTKILSPEDRRSLLAIARDGIQRRQVPPSDPPPNPRLAEPRAVFVTLAKEGQLRGCIGHTSPRWPLCEAVARMAQSAAFCDSRFSPVDPSEFDDIDIEISILSPFQEVGDIEEIEVGEDGLVIEMGMRRGLLLPQVPGPRGWDRLTFLEHTCKKAGLDPDAWKNPESKIFRFQAYVFGEKGL